MSGAVEIDVLVCGLGPAGASAAAAAARAGAGVLAVERNALPGLPVQCAEFVPMMIGSELFASNDARVQNIGHMRTFVGGNAADRAPDFTPDFRGYMIDRARFDAALVEEAKAAGAECRFASPVRSVLPDGTVQLADGSVIRAKVIVGADGPHSPVGRAAGLANCELVETRQITVDLLALHEGTDIFLHADIVGGYAWLFPKGKVCNVGLGVVASEKHRLKPLLQNLHARLVEQGRVGKTVHAHTGGAIPVGGVVGLHAMLGATELLLAGDAAGLTNPVTGAGINAAIISGRLAGEAAASMSAGDGGAAQDYVDEIDSLFGRSLALALKRRRQLLDLYHEESAPTPRQMQDGWIAYPQYWDDGDRHAVAQQDKETRMTA